jgi:lactoylglutathione lyase
VSEISLSFLVLRTTRIDACLEFYRRLGLAFIEEKHGKGPVHFSSLSSGVLIEIYPQPQKNVTEHGTEASIRLGFTVEALASTLESLETTGARVLRSPALTRWGRVAVLLDPDGREVAINEPLKEVE